jgi:hypothetical protein
MLASILKLRKLFALATIVNYKRREASEERFLARVYTCRTYDTFMRPCSDSDYPKLLLFTTLLLPLSLPEQETCDACNHIECCARPVSLPVIGCVAWWKRYGPLHGYDVPGFLHIVASGAGKVHAWDL